MTKDTLEQHLRGASESLLASAREHSWNKISSQCLYILSEIDHTDAANLIERITLRKQINQRKTPQPLSFVVPTLQGRYDDLHLIELYIYHAKPTVTVIEIRYLLRSSLGDYLKGAVANQPMLHCKVPIPPYVDDRKEKFDINWELKTWEYRWKLLGWRCKVNWKLKKMNKNVG